MSFNELGLSATLLQAIADTGYTTPTPIQQHAIPAILTGKDVMAAAQTGTGKTAGFTLPLLQLLSGKAPAKSNHVRALILTPTRELAAQIQESIETYGKHEKLRSLVVFGGVNINPQQLALRKGSDILVATPGRLLDLYQQNAVKFTDLEVLVLDEADRMLDMGFIRDIRRVLQLLPKKRQNLMFSATFSDEIRTLAKTICHQPIEIDVAPRNSTVEAIAQQYYAVRKEHKLPLLAQLLLSTADQALVFSRTKHGANNMVKKLAAFGVTALAIHGNKSQAQRTKALADFKNNKVQVLIATDIAARGIDIELLARVINFDMPQVPEDYVHRIGRTGRAGATGLAISLVSDEDTVQLRAVERLIKRKVPQASYEAASLPVARALPAGADVEDDDRPPRPARNPRQRSSAAGNSRAPRSAQQGNRQPSQAQPQQAQAARRPRNSQAPGQQRNGNTAGADTSRSGQRPEQARAERSQQPRSERPQQSRSGRPQRSEQQSSAWQSNSAGGNRAARPARNGNVAEQPGQRTPQQGSQHGGQRSNQHQSRQAPQSSAAGSWRGKISNFFRGN